MIKLSHLAWPFFDVSHWEFAARVDQYASSHGGSHRQIDLQKLCLAPEILSWHDGLADFAFQKVVIARELVKLRVAPARKQVRA